jgi:two-component system, NarL family, nitrate/nitrite response regulator NarL
VHNGMQTTATRNVASTGQEEGLRLLLADDHHLVREALSYYLRQTAAEVAVEEAASLPEALQKVRQSETPFDAVILDLHMPGMNGLNGLEVMRAEVPGIPVIILSGNISPRETADAVRRGASGVIPKELRGPALINALRLVLAGETYLPATLIDAPSVDETERETLGNLTRRELEVVKLLACGHSNREIAGRLSLAEVTVKLHLHNAFQKMGARSRADAVRIALQKGIGSE